MTTTFTEALESIGSDGAGGVDRLLPILYDELRRLASAKLRGDPAGQTLQATALVHEVYLRLSNESNPHWRNRGQFLAIATETMRRILVDRSRRRLAQKRGGGLQREDIPLDRFPAASDDALAVRVHEALDELALEDSVRAEVVKLKFFAGLTSQEIAQLMEVNEKTVRRHWSFAKVWLTERFG